MGDQPKHVLLCIADSLRYDTVYQTGIGMPYIQNNGIAFTEARSAGCWTLPATSSLFTGLMPHEHGATSQSRAIHKNIPTLAEQMKSAGYKTYQVTANIATTDIFGLHRGFDEVRRIWKKVPPKFNKIQQILVLIGKPRLRKKIFSKDMLMRKMSSDLEMAKTWLQHTYQDIFNEVRKITEECDKKNEKAFVFINLMETHFPYHIAPTFQLDSQGVFKKLKEVHSLFHHLNQSFLKKGKLTIQKEMLEVLKGRQQKAWTAISKDIDSFCKEMHEGTGNLVIFGADHGENFGEQGWTYHFSNVTDAGNKVPLFWLAQNKSEASQNHKIISTRHIYHSILNEVGISTNEPSIIHEADRSKAILQSYWYNHSGKTLDQYKYNQICFLIAGKKYLLRNDQWLLSPEYDDYDAPQFLMMDKNVNPIHELNLNTEEKDFYLNTIKNFKLFSSKIKF